MAIKVHIPTGETSVTVKGLYQWDYGQVLEIECEEIGSEILEAHFACPNMAEAIVRACTFSNGLGDVTIPDECLEQTSAVTVWLCRVDETQRHTIKAITLPLTARTRPSNTRDVPANYTDTYGQLIREVSEAIDELEKGIVTAAKAIAAKDAEHAKIADSAASASYAITAGSANSAGTAEKATLVETELLCTCDISSNGQGTAPTATRYNILCSVVFITKDQQSHCGLYYEHASSSKCYAKIGAYDMTNDGTTISMNSAVAGKLYFYRLA